jgi:AcrR family transcriptional regulator
VAREAGVSRAALYLHFRNKEEVFRSLAERVHAEALAGALAALAEAGPIGERVLRALEAKSLRFLQIVAASPHGAELVEANSRVCGDIAAAKEERFARALADALRRADADGALALEAADLSPAAAAELLLQASRGVKASVTSPPLYRRRLADLVRVLLAGLGER